MAHRHSRRLPVALTVPSDGPAVSDMKCCKDCRHFTDGRYSKVYISPQCNQRGTDSAAFMREWVCGVDEARLYEPKEITAEIGYGKPQD